MPTSQDLSGIIQAYAQGYFPMADPQTGALAWYTSRQRAIMPLDEGFYIPQSLRRVLNQGRFTTAINQDFAGVVAGCADRETTWISPELQGLYQALHNAGVAHSFETWQGGTLSGGVLGLALGGVFIGESMFHTVTEASKVALVYLVEHLRQRGYQLFDAQILNPHLARFGAYTLPEAAYQQRLRQALALDCQFVD
ncbi:MAG: leucyl/phenylalanyl-tRNA--protein transferase [Gloeomargaritaceae cyanobacterium C42_A2020_066]|nr:leucyl/phenylalanyl-tRNA--protein transferase [Gloeomargaritaceae cyanobacterium C42_A2020_066]